MQPPSPGRKTRPSGTGPNNGLKHGLPTATRGPVPPINVLIAEDNNISLRVLTKQMQNLQLRWDTATNGQIAVEKWKTGGYHLVLMDIRMPVMDGLQATKEIRRLENVNAKGRQTSPTTSGTTAGQHSADSSGNNGLSTEPHKLNDDLLPDRGMLFKSPVIIVALTASALESDRNEALNAGCNDFLTKPTDTMWLERKVRERGCMQALIDFDGWRTWKEKTSEDS